MEDTEKPLFSNVAAEDDLNLTAWNNVTEDELQYYPDLSQAPFLRATFIVIYCIIIVLTITGNALVIYMVVSQKKMHNSINYLICNLAVSDILVGAFVAPVKLLEMMVPADFQLLDNTLCTALSFTQSVTIFSTILTLLVISLERFYVIVYPLRRLSNRHRIKLFIALSWILSLLLSSPVLMGSTLISYELVNEYGRFSISRCSDNYDLINSHFRKVYFLFLFFAVYCLPMIIITVTSAMIARTLMKSGNNLRVEAQDGGSQRVTENRRKVAVMMILVSIGFVVCWSPYFLVTFVVECIYNFFNDGHYIFFMLLINMLGFLNSCINPFIYVMNERFREQYRFILQSCFCGLCVRFGWIDQQSKWTRRPTFRSTLSQMSASIRRGMRALSNDDGPRFTNPIFDGPHNRMELKRQTSTNGFLEGARIALEEPNERPLPRIDE